MEIFNVSIIIVNYNTKKLLYDCLKSIYEYTKGISFEVIVSDNGSIDGSLEMLKNDFPQVIIIANNGNLGFGKANNIAARQAKGKYLFFLNSDTILLNNAVKLFYKKAEEKNGKTLLGSYLLNKEKEITISYGNFMTFSSFIRRMAFLYFPILLKIRHFFLKQQKEIVIEREVDFLSGADLFVSKDIFQKLNGFDEKIFMYCEDEDFCRRALQMNFLSVLITEPQIIHLEGQSSKVSKIKKRIMTISFLYYARKLLFHRNQI